MEEESRHFEVWWRPLRTAVGMVTVALLLMFTATIAYAVHIIQLWNRARRPD